MSETTPTEAIKLALYHYEDSDSTSVMKADSWLITSESSNYTRCSEIVEVTFPPLPHSEVINGQIDSLKRQQVRNMATFNVEQNELEGRINDLLALPSLNETGESK